MPKIYIVRGLPGSGKSTKAREIASSLGCVHLETDQFWIKDGKYDFSIEKLGLAHTKTLAIARMYIEFGSDLVISNTMITMKDIKKYVDLAKEHNYDIEIIDMKNDFGNIHSVPNEVINRMKNSWVDYHVI